MKLELHDRIALFFARKARLGRMFKRRGGISGQTSATIRRWIVSMGWTEDASLQEVADSLGLYKEDFSLFFRRVYGKNFLQWRGGGNKRQEQLQAPVPRNHGLHAGAVALKTLRTYP